MKAFLCHSSTDSRFVLQVASYLRRHFEVFAYEEAQKSNEHYITTMDKELRESEIMIVFVNTEFTNWQVTEVNAMIQLESDENRPRSWVLVAVGNQQRTGELPKEMTILRRGGHFLKDSYTESTPPLIVACARDIVDALKDRGLRWRGADQLPFNPHLFDYEKRIIAFCLEKDSVDLASKSTDKDVRKKIEKVRTMLQDGCPGQWPQIMRWPGAEEDNLVPRELIGDFRQEDSTIVAAALTRLGASAHGLCFPEAGPREKLYYPHRDNRDLNVGIVVLGGIAPGINAVIDAIVQRHWLYKCYQPAHTLNIYGFMNGWWAFEDVLKRTRMLRPDTTFSLPEAVSRLHTLETSEHATEGGSMLATWREETLTNLETRQDRLERLAGQLDTLNIDILYIIGGDGSMKAAHALWNVARTVPRKEGAPPLSVVAIPKTMDNDILWMWQSFGFISAVQKAKEIVDQLHTEVKSNPRLCILQLFGSDSGFVVSHAVLASATGHCDLALIPEEPFSMLEIARHLKKRMRETGRSIPYGLVVMAETAIPTDALECLGERALPPDLLAYEEVYEKVAEELQRRLSDPEKEAIREYDAQRQKGKRIQGQTSDQLRRASLRLAMEALPVLLRARTVGTIEEHNAADWNRLRLVANEPRHLLRSAAPSTSDITMAQRLGILAVDNALAGYTDFMISQWLTEYVLVPLELVVLGRKRIPQSGIFWKSVLAKTGQLRARH